MEEPVVEYKPPPKSHIASIFQEYTTPSRVLRSFTNLSNTVIQTALSGQSKFVFEILQNADDAFEDQNKGIEVRFALQDDFLIVHHNGKGFDYYDVERICDYASQIEEVKATDLRKTGYKGLGFKSLFNLSDSIYICSNGYSFRFDKTHWNDPESRPWQVIPIWCEQDELPLRQEHSYDQPVNFILKVNDSKRLECQLREIIDRPELLLYLHRINKLSVDFSGEKHFLERRKENFGAFHKIDFLLDQQVMSTWLSRTYTRSVDREVQASVGGGSRFIYPEKIKKAKRVPFTFTIRCDETLESVSSIEGLCYSTLPTQLHLTVPYHTNSFFILNLDRTQLHENEWNTFLLYQMGILQFYLLKDLAEVDHLKNYVVDLFVREIDHPFNIFSKAFSKGFMEARGKICWLPSHQGLDLLKLGEVWTDEIQFFKQNFHNIRDYKIFPHLIHYDVKHQSSLSCDDGEVKRFTYTTLINNFPTTYNPQLSKRGYSDFISYLYERLKTNHTWCGKLKKAVFLRAKDGTLLSPKDALLEESENPIPDFLRLNPVDNEFLPSKDIDSIKEWFVRLGARRLNTVILILRESILKWANLDDFDIVITTKNHLQFINYLAKGSGQLEKTEIACLKKNLLFRTESGLFKPPKLCYLPDAVSIKEFKDIISNDDKISSSYDLSCLKDFFIRLGVHHEINPIDVLRKGVLLWIKNGEISKRLTKNNYDPIIQYVAEKYISVESGLQLEEINVFKKMLVLTLGQQFQKAQDCYFDSAIPNIKGLEGVIANNKLVSAKDTSKSVYKFLCKIGVKETMNPVEVIRKSILKWICENQIASRINLSNHQHVLKYIADHWEDYSNGLKPNEIQYLKRILILTKSNTFKEACRCYFPSNPDSPFYEEIPMIESIIFSDEFISSEYHRSSPIERLLEELGVRNLTFLEICDRYCDYLIHRENVKWFFWKLVSCWNSSRKHTEKLTSIKHKFEASSNLLAKNGHIYRSFQLYSSRFDNIHSIDPNSIPILEYEKLPLDLEKWLGFKMDLDFKCIQQLLNAVGKKTNFIAEKTPIFFTTLLEQLRQKDKNEIKKHQLSLLSQDNKLKPAKNLYYFIEEDKTCVLDSYYLKRIPNMSHKDTLELGELCGVHTLPFSEKVQPENEIFDNTLKEFYLERLPFIVLQESMFMNENPNITLKRLYDKICAIKLYKCSQIYVKYPFGEPAKIQYHFNDLTLYVYGKWANKRTKIHEHLKKELCLKSNTYDITDMESITSYEKEEWLDNRPKEQKLIFNCIELELEKLLNKGKSPPVEKVKVDQTLKNNKKPSTELDEEEEQTTSESFADESYVDSEEDERSVDSDEDERCVDSDEDERSVDSDEDERSVDSDEDNSLTLGEDKSSEIPPNYIDKPEGKSTNKITSSSVVQDAVEIDKFSIEVEIRKNVPHEEVKLPLEDSLPSSEDREKLIIDIRKKEPILDHASSDDYSLGESSSDESSVVTDVEVVSQQPHPIEKNKSIGVIGAIINEPKVKSSYGTAKGEDDIQVEGTSLHQSDLDIRSNKLILKRISDNLSTENFPSLASAEPKSEKCQIKWLSEEYVFNYLQSYYRNKYPNAQFDLTDGVLLISDHNQRSHNLKIVWLNVNGEKEQPYDLLLENAEGVKRVIEVHTNMTNSDSFNMSHGEFLKKVNKLETKYREKYCIYHVFYANTTSIEALLSPALFKIVPLKNL